MLILYIVCLKLAIVFVFTVQKFDKLKNHYIFYDKYFGKQLSEDEFAQVLHFFLDNGVCFRSDLVKDVIRMLEDLLASIRSLPSFRYFSSSLLLIYDGAECPENLCKRGVEDGRVVEQLDKILSRTKKTTVETMLKDENNLSFLDVNGKDIPTDVDQTHIPYKDIEDACSPFGNVNNKSTPISNRCPETTPTTVEAAPISSVTHSYNSSDHGVPMSKEELVKARCHVDLRMIDFAHSTHSGYTNDPVAYSGPDEGYLTGLKSLITIFQNMETCCSI